MATTNVIRRDIQAGTLAASLAIGGTSINLGQVPAFPTLVSSRGDYIPLTLVNSSNITGCEIVYVTDYTAGNSTAGILRAQETASGGAAAATWASSGSWEHAPTAVDMEGPQGWVVGGNTAGVAQTLVAGTVTIAGGPNITVSQSGNAISISGPAAGGQTNQTLGLYGSSQTYGQSSSSTYDARSISIVGSGGVSIGQSAGSLLISGQTTTPQTVQTQNLHNVTIGGNTAGAGAAISSGTLTLAGGNNITISQAGNALTISGPTTAAQSAQTIGVYASSQTYGQSSSSTYDARTLTIVGSGGVSVGNSAGSILISGQTTAAQSVQSLGIYASSQTVGQSSSSTHDARSLTIVGDGAISVGWSNSSLRISAPNTIAQTVQTLGIYASSQTVGQSSSSTHDARSLTIVGDGAISVGWSNSSLRISAPNTVAQSVQTIGLYASSNTTLTSSGTQDARSLSFRGVGGVSIGISGSEVLISGGAGAAQTNQTIGVYASSQTYGQSSSSTYDARSMTLVGSGGISVGNSAGSILISGAAGAAQTNQTLGIYAVGNTTQSSSNTVDARTFSHGFRGILSGGMSDSTLQISAPDYISHLDVTNQMLNTSSSVLNGSYHVQQFQVPWPLSFSRVDLPVTVNLNSAANNSSAGFVMSFTYALYSSSASTLTPMVGGSSTVTMTWVSNTGRYSNLTGARVFSFPLATVLQPGDYQFGVGMSFSSGFTSGGGNTTALTATVGVFHGIQGTGAFQDYDVGPGQTINVMFPWRGANVLITATSRTLQRSDASVTGVHLQRANMPLVFRNI